MDSRSLDIFFSWRDQVIPSFCLSFPLCVLSWISGQRWILHLWRSTILLPGLSPRLSSLPGAVPVLQSSVPHPRRLSWEIIRSHGDADGSEPSLSTASLPLLFVGSPFQKRAGNAYLAASIRSVGHSVPSFSFIAPWSNTVTAKFRLYCLLNASRIHWLLFVLYSGMPPSPSWTTVTVKFICYNLLLSDLAWYEFFFNFLLMRNFYKLQVIFIITRKTKKKKKIDLKSSW